MAQETKKKNPIGRPKKKLTDLPKDWEKKTLEIYKNGGSDAKVRVQAMDCLPADTFYRMLEEEPHFLETIYKGREMCRIWWEDKGADNLDNPKFNGFVYSLHIRNRFHKQYNKDNKKIVEQETTIKNAEDESFKVDATLTKDQRKNKLLDAFLK